MITWHLLKCIKVKYLKNIWSHAMSESLWAQWWLFQTIFWKLIQYILKAFCQFHLKGRCLCIKLSFFSFTLISLTEWVRMCMWRKWEVHYTMVQELVFFLYNVVPGIYSGFRGLIISCRITFTCRDILSTPAISVLWTNCIKIK